MVQLHALDVRRLTGPGYEDHFGTDRIVDGDCRIDTVLVAFQTDIHQHKDWTMLASESDSLIRCTGNAAHRYPHIFDLSLEHVSDKKLVFHDQDTVDQVGHWTES